MLTAGKISYTMRGTFSLNCEDVYVYPAVKSDWHTAFDARKWILLPDAASLAEVNRYVKSALAWREDPASDRVEDFTTKVDPLLMTTIHTLTSIFTVETPF
jgi:hypothetical protein